MYIRYEVADRIATITLDRPGMANAQNGELLDQLDTAWVCAAEDDEDAVIVLRGEAACNNDQAIRSGDFTGNRSHLAWRIGPHACPARSPTYVVVEAAIDLLLDALPELELAVPAEELVWRPEPFHRALAALPVVFPPSPPLNAV